MSHSEFKNSAIAQQHNFRQHVPMIVSCLVVLTGVAIAFANAIH